MDVWGYLRAVKKYWWMVLLAVLLAVGAAAALTVRTAPKYESTVTFFVNTPAVTIGDSVQGDTFGQKRVATYAQLINTTPLATLIREDIGGSLTTQQISAAITAAGDADTVLLRAAVVDTSPQRSLQIATALSVRFVDMVADLEAGGPGSTEASVSLEVVNGPTLNPNPVDPDPVLNIGLGLLLGLLLGVGAAVLREVLDKTVRTTEDLQSAAGAAVIGIIAFDPGAKKSPLILDSHAKSLRAEAFRQLRTNLQFVDAASPVKVIVVTSSVMDEGKSSTACNLAVTFAEAGKRVLLVEGDLRRPRVAEYLGLEGSVGLTNVLAGQVSILDVLQPWGRGGLTVLASGSIPPNPSELLGSANMSSLMTTLRESFEIVIIDCPPLLPVTDAAVLAAAADGALMIVRYGSTTRGQVDSAVKSLHAVDARVLGTVLNMVPRRAANSYGYGYGSGYYEPDTPGSRKVLDRDVMVDVPLLEPSRNGTASHARH